MRAIKINIYTKILDWKTQCYKDVNCLQINLKASIQFQSKPNSFFSPRAEQVDYKIPMNMQNDNEQPVWREKMRKPAILKMTVT